MAKFVKCRVYLTSYISNKLVKEKENSSRSKHFIVLGLRMTVLAFSNHPDSELQPNNRYAVCKSMAIGYAQSIKSSSKRLEQAKSFSAALLNSYWRTKCLQCDTQLTIAQLPSSRKLADLPIDVQNLATELANIIALLPTEDSAFLIGSLYTAMMPDALRAQLGAYYTPPPLVDRLISLAVSAGFRFDTSSAIDPACGGGAFLVPLALRMWKSADGVAPKLLLKNLANRLRGIELDPFSAWISKVVLEAALLPLLLSARSRLPDTVIICDDALTSHDREKFDLVIGNPPYGRITLSESMRSTYKRSLYGHANLYGLFTDLALKIAKPTGIVAYLTPTSFLGGKYFMNLRALLKSTATPVAFDFVTDRDGVFDNVLQETMLATFKMGQTGLAAKVSSLIPKGMHSAEIENVGSVMIPQGATPWLIPRSKLDSKTLAAVSTMPTRLIDLGYEVSTGQLVWNRFKLQLKNKFSSKTLPLIWAESVTAKGFKFSAEKRNHSPYFELHKNQKFLVTSKSCVLVQRTTSIEQHRRLIAAVLPQEFIDQFGGVVIENHLNMVYSKQHPLVPPEIIELLLNSKIIDQIFRCISGSVAVSAYELNSIPLPNVSQLLSLVSSIKKGAQKEFLEKKISSFYEVIQE